jgi:hypothetical protein
MLDALIVSPVSRFGCGLRTQVGVNFIIFQILYKRGFLFKFVTKKLILRAAYD